MKTAEEWIDVFKDAMRGDGLMFFDFIRDIQSDAVKAAAREAWTICGEVCTEECGPETGCVRIANLNK